MLINRGTQERIVREVTTGNGTTSREGSTITDSILVTLFVDSVTTGDLTVTVTTLTDNGKELGVITFPTVSSPSTELLLKKSAVIMQRFRVQATYTGVCEYEIYVRAIEGAGESSVRVLGPANLETSQVDVPPTPVALIPAALTDRNGVIILNNSTTDTLYVSESSAKLTGQAWPIRPGGTWSLDIASGVALMAESDGGMIDVRIAQAGG